MNWAEVTRSHKDWFDIDIVEGFLPLTVCQALVRF